MLWINHYFVLFRRVFRFVSVRTPWNVIFIYTFVNYWTGLSNGLLAELYKKEKFASIDFHYNIFL